MQLLKDNDLIPYNVCDVPRLRIEDLPVTRQSVLVVNSDTSIGHDLDLTNIKQVEIIFGQHDDGRGFSMATILRQHLGFTGDIFAVGHLIPDQSAMLFSVGFSGIVINDELIARHGKDAWLAGSVIKVSYNRGFNGARLDIMSARHKLTSIDNR